MIRRGAVHRLLIVVAATTLLVAGCSSNKEPSSSSSSKAPTPVVAKGLPDSAYYLQSNLAKWIDPETGYDTSRKWKLDGGRWPVLIIMSPSQAPQALANWKGFEEALKAEGITPVIDKIDGPPRTFHALERSKWPIVYMPLAVFMDYARSPQNQGDAGGLQYVAIAGSTSGGGYSLMARDPVLKSVADLKGKKVGFLNTNPVPGTLLTKAIQEAGLSAKDVPFTFGEAGAQLNAYGKGELDAVVSLNVLRKQLLDSGSHVMTDFAGVGYDPNYTILTVERSVLEQKPEVVDALLEAHYQGQKLAEKNWDTGMIGTMRKSWAQYFESQSTTWSAQRTVPNDAAYKQLLGNMWPDMRLDRDLVADCFKFNTVHKTWGWPADVDVTRIVDYDRFNKVLEKHGEKPQ